MIGPYKFGLDSSHALATCHPLIRRCADVAIKVVDFKCLEGYRGEEAQNRAFRLGNSTLQFPDGNHNHRSNAKDVEGGWADDRNKPLSMALDWAPWYPDKPHIRWNRTQEFIQLGGLWVGLGASICLEHGYLIRWGGNWDRDSLVITDQNFQDLGHVELIASA